MLIEVLSLECGSLGCGSLGCGCWVVLLCSGNGPADFGDKGREDGVPRTDEPLLGHARPAWRQGVKVAGADAAVLDKSGTLQHVQVLAHGGPADRQSLRQLSYRRRAVAQELEDAPTDWFAQSVEDGFSSLVTHKQRLL